MKRSLIAERFREIFDKRSAEEVRTLAHVKRFMERYIADARFRRALEQNAKSPRRVTEPYGIAVDPQQLLPLFDWDYMRLRSSPSEMEHWPVARLWADYRAELDECRTLYCHTGDCAEQNPLFHAWRRRQMRRSESEIGLPATTLAHPILAFELSAGCTVGCWFCGLSAERFRSFFPYTPENARLWQEILEHCGDLFGNAAQTGLCYWATDPCDNPDYPAFLEDYLRATGHLPKTTTALPLRDLDLTRKVLGLSDRYPCSINRFSILTLKIFDQVQETFSAEELMRVDLVLQNHESLMGKKPVGRAQYRQGDDKQDRPALSPLDHANFSTLVSLSGFLVNMVDRTIQLITPTRTSERWPLGCRILGKRSFQDAGDFRTAIEDLIRNSLPQELGGSDVVSFRDDLRYQPVNGGFELHAVKTRYSLAGFPGASQLGEIIHQGGKTVSEIRNTLVESGSDIVVATDIVQKLFERGLLNEDPELRGAQFGEA